MIEIFAYMLERFDSIEAKLDAQAGIALITVEMLEERYGLSRSAIQRAPWRLPNFGVADCTTTRGRKAWRQSTVDAWMSIPEATRKERWILMSAKQKREALGVSA